MTGSPSAEAEIAAELTDAGDDVEMIGMCVQLEAEAATIEDPAERAEMLEGFGLGEGALFRMVRSAYHLLGAADVPHHGRQGEPGLDVRARARRRHSAPAGSTPTSSAASSGPRSSTGEELLDIGSWTKAKELGKIRLEGKDYVVQDGDVMEFRFNV